MKADSSQTEFLVMYYGFATELVERGRSLDATANDSLQIDQNVMSKERSP